MVVCGVILSTRDVDFTLIIHTLTINTNTDARIYTILTCVKRNFTRVVIQISSTIVSAWSRKKRSNDIILFRATWETCCIINIIHLYVLKIGYDEK